jgi:hypothetical protein
VTARATVALSGVARNITFVRYEGMAQDDDGIRTAPNGDRVAWFRTPTATPSR